MCSEGSGHARHECRRHVGRLSLRGRLVEADQPDFQHTDGRVGQAAAEFVAIQAAAGNPGALLVAAFVFRGDVHVGGAGRIDGKSRCAVRSDEKELVWRGIDDEGEGSRVRRHGAGAGRDAACSQRSRLPGCGRIRWP